MSSRDVCLLLVDDDPSQIQVMGRMLSDYPDQRFATTGEAALRIARETTPDLILLDVVGSCVLRTEKKTRLQAARILGVGVCAPAAQRRSCVPDEGLGMPTASRSLECRRVNSLQFRRSDRSRRRTLVGEPHTNLKGS